MIHVDRDGWTQVTDLANPSNTLMIPPEVDALERDRRILLFLGFQTEPAPALETPPTPPAPIERQSAARRALAWWRGLRGLLSG